MPSPLALIADALRDLRRLAPALLGYDVAYRVIAFAIVGPTSAAILAAIVALSGKRAVGNTELVGFALSPAGVATLLAAVALGLAAWFLEHAGLMIVGIDAHRHGHPSAVAALVQTFRSLPTLAGLGLRMAVAHLLLAAPFAGAVGLAYLALWGDRDLYYLVTTRPPAFWTGAAVAGVVALLYAFAAVALLLRWAYALPLVLDRGLGARAALAASAPLARRSWRTLLIAFAAWTAAGLAVAGALVWGFDALGGLAIDAAGDSLAIALPTAAALLAGHVLLATIVQFVGASVSSLLLLRAYRAADGSTAGVDAAGPPPARRSWRRPAVLGLAAVAAGAALVTVVVFESLDLGPPIAVTAHRGDKREAPENTAAAVRSAAEVGADYAEIDVQLTADGALVVIHDTDLRRVAGDPRAVRDLILDQITALPVGAGSAPEFADERVPTFAQVAEAAGDRLRLNVELKPTADNHAQLAEATLAEIHRLGFDARCIITSLSTRALAEVRRVDPDIPIGFIISESVGDPTRLDVDLLSLREPLATRRAVARAHRRGLAVHVWTVSDPGHLEALIARGVDNVITDDAPAMIARRDELGRLGEVQLLLLRYRDWIGR